MLEGMRANNVSLTCSRTSPGDEESKAREASCSMPKVVDMTRAAGTPLPVTSPTTSPRRPPDKRWKSKKSSHLTSRLVVGGDLPALQLGHLLGQRRLLDAPCHLPVHPFQKSTPGFKDASIHGLSSQ